MIITLLSSLPHIREDIDQDRQRPERDYVYANLGGHRRSTDEIWEEVGELMQDLTCRLLKACDQADIRVVLRAGSTDVAEAATDSDLMIILAHWKGPRLVTVPHDLQTHPRQIREQLRACVSQRILPESILNQELDALPENKAKDKCAGWLNSAIQHKDKTWLPFEHLLGSGFDSAAISSAYASTLTRVLIDETLTRDFLLPGARLDLEDGLCNPSKIAACFPDQWHGVCDFICCQSEYLAEEVKRHHLNAVFRADSRSLRPRQVIASLTSMIPHLRSELAGGLADGYIRMAHAFDRPPLGSSE